MPSPLVSALLLDVQVEFLALVTQKAQTPRRLSERATLQVDLRHGNRARRHTT